MADDRVAYPQQMTTEMRWFLRSAAVLVFIAGVQLFIMSESTDRYFAWTIRPPLTAAFLGAAYWATCLISLLASRRDEWARARAVLPTVLTFSTLTLVVTLLHLDRFHFDSDRMTAVLAAWAWLVVYVLVPPVGIALYVRQMRQPGSDPPRTTPLATWVRGVLIVQGVVMMVLGIALFVAPLDVAPRFWPWVLSDLTGRAVAVWLIATAVAAWGVLRENDLRRVEPAVATYLALGILQFIVLARYGRATLPGSSERLIDWSSPAIWLYVVFMASVLGVAGFMAVTVWVRGSRPEADPVTNPTVVR